MHPRHPACHGRLTHRLSGNVSGFSWCFNSKGHITTPLECKQCGRIPGWFAEEAKVLKAAQRQQEEEEPGWLVFGDDQNGGSKVAIQLTLASYKAFRADPIASQRRLAPLLDDAGEFARRMVERTITEAYVTEQVTSAGIEINQVKITYSRPINRNAAHPAALNLCCAECGAKKTPKGKPLLACAGCKEVGCRQARTSASRARGLTDLRFVAGVLLQRAMPEKRLGGGPQQAVQGEEEEEEGAEAQVERPCAPRMRRAAERLPHDRADVPLPLAQQHRSSSSGV